MYPSFLIFPQMNLPDSPPKFFRTWNHFYAFVVGWLILLIMLFHLFTIYYS